jgi:putative PIN family toxin of toxin-antitoxin system
VKAAFDSRIILSAFFIPGSFQDRILKKLLSGKFEHITSVPILREVDKFLLYTFREPKESRKCLVDFIKELSTIVYPVTPVKIIAAQPMDNLIFEIAEEAKVDFIVSGDKKHILPVNNYKNIPVLAPPAFSRML